jgi:hypothetical protein
MSDNTETTPDFSVSNLDNFEKTFNAKVVCNGDVCTIEQNKPIDEQKNTDTANTDNKQSSKISDIPFFDQILSQMLKNVLTVPENSQETTNNISQLFNKFLPSLEKKQESEDESEYDEGDESDYEGDESDYEGDEGDEGDESDYEGDDEEDSTKNMLSNTDPRWGVINKLLESHVSLTKSVEFLLKNEKSDV